MPATFAHHHFSATSFFPPFLPRRIMRSLRVKSYSVFRKTIIILLQLTGTTLLCLRANPRVAKFKVSFLKKLLTYRRTTTITIAIATAIASTTATTTATTTTTTTAAAAAALLYRLWQLGVFVLPVQCPSIIGLWKLLLGTPSIGCHVLDLSETISFLLLQKCPLNYSLRDWRVFEMGGGPP